MDLVSFLDAVMPPNTRGFFNYCLRNKAGEWHELWKEWPNDKAKIISDSITHRREFDTFFSPALFHTRCSEKQCVMPSSTLFCDVDLGDIAHAPVQPSILIKTSPGRHQAAWQLSEELDDIEYAEQLSRKLTYSVEGSDRSGWPLGHKMRLPNTYNHKYLDGPHPIEVVESSLKKYSAEELELLSDADSITLARYDPSFIENPPVQAPDGRGPHELIESVRERLPARVISEYTIPTKDRSSSLWALMCACFRAGLAREQVYWVAKHSANNKFSALKYHAARELAKDVLRAEQEVVTKKQDIRNVVRDIRLAKITELERNEILSKVIHGNMLIEGNFAKTHSQEEFYIPRDTSKPIYVSRGSVMLDSLLDLKYGLNPSEKTQTYIKHHLIDYALGLTPTLHTANLSHYDEKANLILIHSGSNDVYSITANNIERARQGVHSVIFPWTKNYEPFNLQRGVPQDYDWSLDAFGPLDNVIDLEAELARCLLRVFVLFVFVRQAAMSRPILAFFGQPGGGKTTAMARINMLFYGAYSSINVATNDKDYDSLATTSPFMVLDGVDSYNNWLPDKLSQSARVTDLDKRRLFSDNDTVKFTRQALVGLTAHNPKFMREDIADRLLLFNFSRLSKFQPETPIYNALNKARPRILTAICQDLAKILAVPKPTSTDLNFRVEDFARLGEWIAQGIDQLDVFREAMRKLSNTTTEYTLNEDETLIHSLQEWMKARDLTTLNEFLSVTYIFDHLMLHVPSSEIPTFKKKYSSPNVLGRKLWTIQATLKSMFKVEWEMRGGARFWKIQALS